jgi:protocadherin alpha
MIEFLFSFVIQPSQRIYGDYCECDDFSCPRKNDLVCSGIETKSFEKFNSFYPYLGPNHGVCGCDKRCQCNEGWTGDDCSCTTKTDSCLVNKVNRNSP